MENFILSLNAVLPLTLMIGMGYGIKRIFNFEEKDLKKLNDLCFKVFLPILLFKNIYQINVGNIFDLRLIVFTTLIIGTIFLLLCLLIPHMEADRKKIGVLIQSIFRSNFIIFGLPIAISLYGEEGAGTVSLLTAIVIPLFNILAVIILEVYCGEKADLGKIVKGIAKNPLIWGVLTGGAAMLIGISLPGFLEKTISDVAQIATPFSLIVLGGSFTFRSAPQYFKQLAIGICGKLVIVPLVGITLAIMLGLRNVELLSIIILLGAPAAVSSFTMAQQMNADFELAGQLVVWGSALSSVTVFLWIFMTKQLGLI